VFVRIGEKKKRSINEPKATGHPFQKGKSQGERPYAKVDEDTRRSRDQGSLGGCAAKEKVTLSSDREKKSSLSGEKTSQTIRKDAAAQEKKKRKNPRKDVPDNREPIQERTGLSSL